MSEAQQLQELEINSDVQTKLADRLTIQEYCCYTIRRVATNLDAYARATAAPKTKSYALDADATEDPTMHRIWFVHRDVRFGQPRHFAEKKARPEPGRA